MDGMDNQWDLVEDILDQEYQKVINTEIGPILNAYDNVRRLLRSKEVSQFIPEIVVVGDQSSGKSSLLETISGINLPRGDGMVTKVPLELQLRCNTESTAQTATIFYLDKEETIEDLRAIPDLILKAQEHIVGKDQKTVKDEVIRLLIYSPSLPNLSLTDQPGLIHNIAPGQPTDLPARIKQLALKHTQGQSKVVLCVVPGNVDPSTCLALSIAEQQDPRKERTICVITKVDMGLKSEFDIGSVVNYLESKSYEYVAVRNRTAKEVSSGVTIKELRQSEENMMQDLDGIIPCGSCGVVVLIKRLVEIQRGILGGSLQILVQKVEEALQKVTKELQSLPPSVSNRHDAYYVVHAKLKEAQLELSNIAKEPSKENFKTLERKNSQTHEMVQFSTSANLECEFKNFLSQIQRQFQRPLFLQTGQINNIIELSKPLNGTQLPNFPIYYVPAQLYDRFLWSTLSNPCSQLVDTVHVQSEKLLLEIVSLRFSEFPKLCQVLETKVKDFMKSLKDEVVLKSDYFIELEKDPYTQDTSYMTEIQQWMELFSTQHKSRQHISYSQAQATRQGNSTQYTSSIQFGIGNMIPALGTSWAKNGVDLINHVISNPTNENMAALDIMLSLASIGGVVLRRFVNNLCLLLRHTYLKELPSLFVQMCECKEDLAWRLLKNEGNQNKRDRLTKEIQNYKEALIQLRNCY